MFHRTVFHVRLYFVFHFFGCSVFRISLFRGAVKLVFHLCQDACSPNGCAGVALFLPSLAESPFPFADRYWFGLRRRSNDARRGFPILKHLVKFHKPTVTSGSTPKPIVFNFSVGAPLERLVEQRQPPSTSPSR